jgi:hypothetical protein
MVCPRHSLGRATLVPLLPYIGPAIGMFLPSLVTFAALPGWTPILMVLGFSQLMELISNNVMEPYYTGLEQGRARWRSSCRPFSELAVGPLGLFSPPSLSVWPSRSARPQFNFSTCCWGTAGASRRPHISCVRLQATRTGDRLRRGVPEGGVSRRF